MFEQLKEKFVKVCAALWCHRMAYAGLALAYGAKCFGIIDADLLAQIVTGLYVAMVAQGH